MTGNGDSERSASVWARIAEHSGGDTVTIAHVCSTVTAASGVDGAAVTVFAGPSVWDTVHASDPVAAELEEWQATYGEGPRVDSAASGGPVLVADLEYDGHAAHWPVFTPAALGSGARAVFALPLQVGAIRLGVLSLYRSDPGGFDAGQLADALGFTDAACTILLDGGTKGPSGPQHLHVHVHQATGMVLAQLGVNAETAFIRLRAYAFANGRTLGDVARDVVDRQLRFDPDPPHEPGTE